VLEGSCHIKVLRVLRTTSNCPGNIGIEGIKEAGKHFAYIYRQGIIRVLVTHFKGSKWGNRNLIRLTVILRLLRLSGTILRLY